MNTDYQQQIADLSEQYHQEQESGLQICPCCGESVAHEQMTVSVNRGVMCQDCDLTCSCQPFY